MKKIKLLFVFSLLVAPLSSCGGNPNVLSDGSTFKVLHFNDTHGAIDEQGEEPGMGKLASYVNKVRKASKNRTVVVSSGDMFQGSLESNTSRGKIMIDMMKSMQFDAMSLGNHEFDWGIEVLKENKEYAEDAEFGNWAVPFLAGNIVYDGEYVLGDLSTTFSRGGATISIIGAVDPAIKNSIDASIVEDYTFENPEIMVANEAQRLREAGSDLIIFSSHYDGGYTFEGIADYVDCIFTGHNHVDSIGKIINKDNKEVPIIESENNGKAIGEVTFKYSMSSQSFIVKDYKNVTDVESQIKTIDKDIQKIYDYYLDEIPFEDGEVTADSLREIKTTPVGRITSASPYAGSSSVSTSNVLKLYNTAQLEVFRAIDPLVVASSYNEARSTLPVGDITYADIYKAFPFDNTTVIVELTGMQLINWMTSSTRIEGLDNPSIVTTNTYRLVTCTYVIYNREIGNYLSVIGQFDGVYQRQVLFRAFSDHPTHTPVG